LLRALAEQLKLPLLHIARQAELATLNEQEAYSAIMRTADMALQLIDGYLLSTDVNAQEALDI
jgi:hypothetical protein